MVFKGGFISCTFDFQHPSNHDDDDYPYCFFFMLGLKEQIMIFRQIFSKQFLQTTTARSYESSDTDTNQGFG